MQRQAVMLQAFEAHPERFVAGPPVLKAMPEAVWINPPKPEAERKHEKEPENRHDEDIVEHDRACYKTMPGETEASAAGEQLAKG